MAIDIDIDIEVDIYLDPPMYLYSGPYGLD